MQNNDEKLLNRVWPHSRYKTKYSHCFKIFFEKNRLLTHSEERKYKYKCHYKACHQRFKRLIHLKEHKLIRSEVNSFRCVWNTCENVNTCGLLKKVI
jgi:hypothetical protein